MRGGPSNFDGAAAEVQREGIYPSVDLDHPLVQISVGGNREEPTKLVLQRCGHGRPASLAACTDTMKLVTHSKAETFRSICLQIIYRCTQQDQRFAQQKKRFDGVVHHAQLMGEAHANPRLMGPHAKRSMLLFVSILSATA